MKKDHVDLVLEQWQQQRPDLDANPMAIFGRLSRMNSIVEPKIKAVLKSYGLTLAEFDVLAALKRGGQPLTPTTLYNTTMLTSGAMTARLDKLEQRGFIQRQPSATDRRSLLIELTEAGLQLVDTAVVAHVENEQQMLACFSEEEKEQLAKLMKIWLLAHE
ncbi:MarR family transcriptional regulator [Endozoicomonas sp. SM1973]|uniref:MarR family transcriptional regulator n=1 Tax=Spartinivicinus marinus TaxID=2994442 RepID=A0A853I2V4_9GAMM|nr:MarR family transcriptional regulator [Spartinivicinus marinus]MCX4029093.1 MarR family transcriptional regulator [Spartinivicinus marinus]NYZ67713.1 MarR family transcriptional regulator [Spartinivicinus marinus]